MGLADSPWRSRHFDLHQPTGRSPDRQRIEPTLSLVVVTLVFAVSIAVPIGVVARGRPTPFLDRAIMAFAVLGFSVPVFVIGYLLAFVFALQLDWLPVQGYNAVVGGP